MDGRRARLVDPALDGVPTIGRRPVAPRGGPLRRLAAARAAAEVDASGGRSYLLGRLSRGWALALGAGWPLAFVVVTALEPAPTDPEAAVPPLVAVASLVFLTAMALTVVAAAIRLRLAAPAALVTGIVALGFAVSCPVSGHHSYGLWWVSELAVLGAMTALSAAALGRRALSPGR